MSDTISATETQANRARAILAQMRHELRTPINAIMGYSELLLEDAAEPGREKFVPDLRKINDEGRRLLSLVNEILDPAKIDSKADLNLEAFAADIHHRMRTPINTVIGYSELLLEDAQDLDQQDFVSDLGRIHESGRRLLAMIDDVVNLPKIAAGQTYLELRDASLSGGIEEMMATIRFLEEQQLLEAERGSLLVVDDTEMNRDLLSRQLLRQGHTVAVAENGRQALEMMQAQRFDLVLLDIIMPELNGYQVLQQLKTDPDLRHVPVIMISSLDEVDSAVRCLEIGAEDYLPKPFNPVVLRARISASLEKKRLRDREQELYEEVQRNYQQLRELEKLRDSLTHMIVHDLRTPLTSIVTGLPTIEMLGELNPGQKEMLDMGITGGNTLLGMINDLLDVSKMESGTMKLDLSSVTAGAVVAAAAQQVAYLAKDKKLNLKTEVAPGLPSFLADDDKLRRTLVNLLGNAIKFTPTAGTVTVAARLREEENAIQFEISDTGEGIPPESFGKIFEKFGQVEGRKSGRRMSTGLGLTFCKMAVEAHGGRIWVESELGQGSSFLFTIPLS